MPNTGGQSNNDNPKYLTGTSPVERPINLKFHYLIYTRLTALSSSKIPEMRKTSRLNRNREKASQKACASLALQLETLNSTYPKNTYEDQKGPIPRCPV